MQHLRSALTPWSSIPLAIGLVLLVAVAPASAQESGILEVKSNVDGAEVFVDDELLGLTPFLEIIPAGAHAVRVMREGFESHVQRVSVPADTTITLTARLVRIAPALHVQVDVDNAKVFLDDQQVGVGGRVVVDPAKPGLHRLTVEAEDFGRWTGEVELLRGSVTPVNVALRGSLGSIVIHSDPEGAQVFLDGKDYGLSPTTIEPLPSGPHGLDLRLDGHPRALKAVQLPPGEKITVDTKLGTEGGNLVIRPSPATAVVSVNGVPLGTGRQELGPLQPGEYSVRATAEGHLDFVGSVAVQRGKKASLAARLEPFSSGRQAKRLVGPAPGGGGGGASAVVKHPGFWLGVGGGVGAVVAVVVTAAAVSNANQDTGSDAPPQPAADISFALP